MNVVNGRNIHETLAIFIGLLLARNCITKVTNKKYKKTEKFNTWLSDRLNDMEEGRSVEQSNILELVIDEQGREIDKKTGKFKCSIGGFKA
jgi:lipopolysaccharide biosynthesis regulator YciM